MKRCTRCSKEKPLEEFYGSKTHRDGLYPYCKDCVRQRNHDYYGTNRKRVRAINDAWRAKNPQRRKIHDAAYQERNRDEINARHRAWYGRNREREKQRDALRRDDLRVYGARYYERNRESLQAYRVRNRERKRAYDARYRAANLDVIRKRNRLRAAIRRAAKKSATAVPFTAVQLDAKFAYWNNCCWVCGGPATTVDHVKPLAAGGPHILCNMRPACISCNSSKRHEWPLPSRAMIAGFCS